MNEDYVSYELAKKLKACRFYELCNSYYSGNGSIAIREYPQCFNCYKDLPMYSRPTLWQVAKWLREKKGIYAYCEPNCLVKWFARVIDLAKNEDLLFDGEMFDDYEEAAEYAFSAALKLIKKGE